MTSIIHVGQSKFFMVLIDEGSHECILDYIQTLCELEVTPVVHETFLKDTNAACTKMLGAQEVNSLSRL
jgi:coatomer subunit beta